MSILISFLLLASLSTLFGVCYVAFLTCHPLKMNRYLATALVAFLLAALVLGNRFNSQQRWPALGVALVAFLAGYLGMTGVVLSRKDERPLPQLTRQPGDPGLGHSAVVYLAHGEPETFDPIGWLNQFREFDRQKISFVPFFARPLFIYALRKKYLAVGKSDHHAIHFKMISSLETAFRRQGDAATRFYLSFLDDYPHPDEALIQALNEGASRIIVCEVFLTVSSHTAEGKEQIARLLEQFPDIPVRSTGPLYDSLTMQRMFVERANRSATCHDKSKIGVLLVGHGQPDEWDRAWPSETEQEIGFRLEVLKRFEADGYKVENMSLAWMEFKEPKPARKIEEFIHHGVQEILYFPAAISADSIHSQYDIPELVHMARVPANIPLKNLGAWNDDPLVIQAIKEKIDRALQSF